MVPKYRRQAQGILETRWLDWPESVSDRSVSIKKEEIYRGRLPRSTWASTGRYRHVRMYPHTFVPTHTFKMKGQVRQTLRRKRWEDHSMFASSSRVYIASSSPAKAIQNCLRYIYKKPGTGMHACNASFGEGDQEFIYSATQRLRPGWATRPCFKQRKMMGKKWPTVVIPRTMTFHTLLEFLNFEPHDNQLK